MIFFESEGNIISGGDGTLHIYSRVNDIHGDPIFDGDVVEHEDYGGNTTYDVEFKDGQFTIASLSGLSFPLNQETVQAYQLVKI